MGKRITRMERSTKETTVSVIFDPDQSGTLNIKTGVPFFDHMLKAMSFHGGFSLTVQAEGDLDIDYHHLVEDVGLVLGDTLTEIITCFGDVQRYGHAVIPMDEALAEVAVDVCGRANVVFAADFPQERVGLFDLALIREFIHALATRARITLHARIVYGVNAHHMAEALFKALGKALRRAYQPAEATELGMSTKGTNL